MKRKDEILNNYYTQGTDGMPEIAADGLLKAMDEYAEQAFNAARLSKDSASLYPTFAHYKAATEQMAQHKNDLTDSIRFMAESILEQFIPDDPSAQNFSFEIKTGGIYYTVFYIKNLHGQWEFAKFSEQKL